MNFLAHIYLSCDNEDLLIGNFIADFIRNKEVPNFSPEVQKGIILHRQIDTFTDKHPLVKKGTYRLQEKHHKYAPVIVDVWYDYLLANNWERYSGESLDDFCEGVYQILEKRINDLPVKLQKRLPMMIEHKWLQAYGTDEGIRYTFKRLSERLSKPEYLDGVVDNLLSFNEEMTEEFNSFFPEVIEYVRENCKCD
ncbi:MAG: ACP phosphodiesterase [Saprospiraceae bacterium]